MPGWISDNIGAFQALAALFGAAVWMVYLQIILSGLRRQRRSEILMTLAGRKDLSSCILISNLGFEPIYILDILVRSHAGDDEALVSVVDRIDPSRQDDGQRSATLQSPLKTGEHVEAGRLDEMLRHASHWAELNAEPQRLHRLELTVAAVTAATSSIVAARRVFHIERDEDGMTRIRPERLYAEQIRSRRGRRQIERQLQSMM